MLKQFIQRVAAFCEKNGTYIYITGTSPNDVYMIRHYVIPRNRFFNIYIHTFLRSDRDDYHDHPWHFWTWIVRGGYTEYTPDKRTVRSEHNNSFIYRRATDLHKVILKRSYSLSERHLAPMTLCFTGPTIREWGFVKDDSWIDWKTYLGVPENEQER